EGCSNWGDLSCADHSEDDSNSFETPTPTTPTRRIYSRDPEPLPLMEGQGKSLKVLGFSQNQRADFLQILIRIFVVNLIWRIDYDWMKHKSYEEITDFYCIPFSGI
ncbi:hypothetical protein V8G54_025832, partial [Vigna mungo]